MKSHFPLEGIVPMIGYFSSNFSCFRFRIKKISFSGKVSHDKLKRDAKVFWRPFNLLLQSPQKFNKAKLNKIRFIYHLATKTIKYPSNFSFIIKCTTMYNWTLSNRSIDLMTSLSWKARLLQTTLESTLLIRINWIFRAKTY